MMILMARCRRGVAELDYGTVATSKVAKKGSPSSASREEGEFAARETGKEDVVARLAAEPTAMDSQDEVAFSPQFEPPLTHSTLPFAFPFPIPTSSTADSQLGTSTIPDEPTIQHLTSPADPTPIETQTPRQTVLFPPL